MKSVGVAAMGDLEQPDTGLLMLLPVVPPNVCRRRANFA
jgi:hypothetical protein